MVAGIPAIEIWDWTFGEIMGQARAAQERQRRNGQMLAYVANGEADLIASRFSNGTNPEIWEVFPFWSKEEIQEFRVEKYRRLMEKYAAAGGARHV